MAGWSRGGAATVLPSLGLTVRLVGREVYTARAETFVPAAFPNEGRTRVVARDLERTPVPVVGAEVSPERHPARAATRPQFGLEGSEFVSIQTETQRRDVAALREDAGKDLHRNPLAALEGRARRIHPRNGGQDAAAR